MSGGHFDYNQWMLGEIASKIERDIALAHYPYDKDILEVKDETPKTMKEAYRQMRIAEIYVNRVDWMMSGDDSEETLQERLKEELEDFEEEFRNKDWTLANEDSEDD